MGLAKEVDAEQFAMNILLENPSLSIDSVIREVSHNFRTGIAKDKVTRLRRKVQEMIGRGHGGGVPMPKDEPEPFNPPRFVTNNTEPEEFMTQATKAATKEEDDDFVPTGKLSSTPEERRHWFSNWALDNPGATVEAARRALHEHFAVAIGTKAITDILGEARRIHADSPDPTVAPVTIPSANPTIQEYVEMGKRLGIKRLEISNDDYIVEMKGTLR